ncbi:hypothetical protein B0H21DRAFT_869922 [Amylocystis lapponica]|nr:hypothetical protein B0H21DRAFT_869922 [Amylocystis lapponica]
MSTDNDAHVYARELFRARYGLPLWENDRGLLVGDVGYMRDGGFYRVFNILRAQDDAIQMPYGVPPAFEPFHPPHPVQSFPASIPAGRICSPAVEARPGVDPGSLVFTCTEDTGAFAVITNEATYHELRPSAELLHYVQASLASWISMLEECDTVDLDLEDLVLIVGTHETSDTLTAVFAYEGTTSAITLDSGSDATYGCLTPSLGVFPSNCSHQLSHADGTGRENEHCFPFVQYYKVKRRHALGEVDEGREEELDDIDIVDSGELFKPYDPVVFVLDYILKHLEATIAIASTLDVVALCKSNEIPKNIQAFLENRRPGIDVDASGGGLIVHRD